MEAAQMRDDAALGKYFSMMLHIDDDDLDPFEYKLLGHYRKIAGLYHTDVIFESNETTAKATKMTVAKMRTARKSLAEKGCIKVEDRNGRTLTVHVVDRMAENTQRYSKADPYENREGYRNRNIRPIEIVTSDVTKSAHDSRIEESKKESPQPLVAASVATKPEIRKPAPKPKKVKVPRQRDLVFDAIALGSFGMNQVKGKTGGRIALLASEVKGCAIAGDNHTPEQLADLAANLAKMYAWYKVTFPDRKDPPSKTETICKYLAMSIPKDKVVYRAIEPEVYISPTEAK